MIPVVFTSFRHFLVYSRRIGDQMLEVDCMISKYRLARCHLLWGLITGMSQSTTKAHVVRAALEGISYQTREVNFGASFQAMGIPLETRLLMRCMMIAASDSRNWKSMEAWQIINYSYKCSRILWASTSPRRACLKRPHWVQHSQRGKLKASIYFNWTMKMKSKQTPAAMHLEYTTKVTTGERVSRLNESLFRALLFPLERENHFNGWKKAVLKSFERLTPPLAIENKGENISEIESLLDLISAVIVGTEDEKTHLSSTTVAWVTLTSVFSILLYMISRHH